MRDAQLLETLELPMDVTGFGYCVAAAATATWPVIIVRRARRQLALMWSLWPKLHGLRCHSSKWRRWRRARGCGVCPGPRPGAAAGLALIHFGFENVSKTSLRALVTTTKNAMSMKVNVMSENM